MPKRVLIVDDAMFMRTMLRNILIIEGYTIHEAVDGDQAVKAYATYRPDIVLMDLTMPVKDGLTAIKEIRASDPEARIVVCSALGQKEMVVEAIQSGAKDFVVKPFDPDRVKTSVKNLIGTSKVA